MDDTARLQALFSKGGMVVIAPGTYYVDAIKGLRPVSNSDISLEGVTLKVIPNGSPKYAAIRCREVSDVTITGGTIVGDRKEHKPTGSDRDEWGHGLRIGPDAKNITVRDMVSKDCWGDGFYVGGAEKVRLDGIIADGNRRQGLSLVEGHDIHVWDSTFINTGGTRPEDGIDIEPGKDEKINWVKISTCRFINNANCGVEVNGNGGSVKNVTVEKCTFQGQRPVKVKGVPGAGKYEPSLWAQFMGKVFGNWSGYPTSVKL